MPRLKKEPEPFVVAVFCSSNFDSPCFAGVGRDETGCLLGVVGTEGSRALIVTRSSGSCMISGDEWGWDFCGCIRKCDVYLLRK